MNEFADYIPQEFRNLSDVWDRHVGRDVGVLEGTKVIYSGTLRTLPKDNAGRLISHFMVGSVAVKWSDHLVLFIN